MSNCDHCLSRTVEPEQLVLRVRRVALLLAKPVEVGSAQPEHARVQLDARVLGLSAADLHRLGEEESDAANAENELFGLDGA